MLILLGVVALATVAALLLLAESICPANVRYVVPKPELQDHMAEVQYGAAAAGRSGNQINSMPSGRFAIRLRHIKRVPPVSVVRRPHWPGMVTQP